MHTGGGEESGGLINFKHTSRPSIAPEMHTLRPITLKDVAKKVNYIHTDRVLFVTTIYQPYKVVGTSVLVEDSNGDCMMLSLYN